MSYQIVLVFIALGGVALLQVEGYKSFMFLVYIFWL
jgi:hypothetical protein